MVAEKPRSREISVDEMRAILGKPPFDEAAIKRGLEAVRDNANLKTIISLHVLLSKEVDSKDILGFDPFFVYETNLSKIRNWTDINELAKRIHEFMYSDHYSSMRQLQKGNEKESDIFISDTFASYQNPLTEEEILTALKLIRLHRNNAEFVYRILGIFHSKTNKEFYSALESLVGEAINNPSFDLRKGVDALSSYLQQGWLDRARGYLKRVLRKGGAEKDEFSDIYKPPIKQSDNGPSQSL